MKLFDFTLYSKLESLNSGWIDASEGMRISGSSVEVDFEKDEKGDVVKLQEPKNLKVTRKEKVPVYRGYALEKVDDLKYFMEIIKKEGAISKEKLHQLIALTYPKELIEKNILLLFITGSSDPLSANIAESLKEMYYPNAKIIDVLKQYYGVDPTEMIDWEEYEKADQRTKEMINTYLNQFKYGKTLADLPRTRFEGYIKKSSGLQSGARSLLKKGHRIDDYIISNIVQLEENWKKKYMGASGVTQTAALKYRPNYLFVDDTIIEGSTLRGIFAEMQGVLTDPALVAQIGTLAQTSIYGYCLFSYKS